MFDWNNSFLCSAFCAIYIWHAHRYSRPNALANGSYSMIVFATQYTAVSAMSVNRWTMEWQTIFGWSLISNSQQQQKHTNITNSPRQTINGMHKDFYQFHFKWSCSPILTCHSDLTLGERWHRINMFNVFFLYSESTRKKKMSCKKSAMQLYINLNEWRFEFWAIAADNRHSFFIP